MRESRSISRIAKLLEHRLTGKSYERYLGLVAAVRTDFQRLSDLMKSMRRDNGDDVSGLKPSGPDCVFYIDDLDRCPGEKSGCCSRSGFICSSLSNFLSS